MEEANVEGGILAVSGPVASIVGTVGLIVFLAITILMVAGFWKTFAKAGKPGWAAIVPVYNVIILLQIAGKPVWWVVFYILSVIPIINFIAGPISMVLHILVSLEVAKKFGKGGGFGVGLALLGFIFFPILGFGKAQYKG